MKSEERKRKRNLNRSSSMDSKNDMEEVKDIVESSSDSDSSFDLCKDIDNVETNVVSAVQSEAVSEGTSSDYDFCDVDEKDDESAKSPKAESSIVVSDITGVDEGSVDESMKSSKVESSINVVSDFIDETIKSCTSEVSGAVSDVGPVEKDTMQVFIKTLTGETITLDVERSDTIDKESSKEDLSDAVSELESESDVESHGSEDSEGSMGFNDYYYDEQFAEVSYAKNPAYEQLCTNYQELKVMLLKDIIKENALPYLPAKSLTRFRSISKEWDIWIRSSFLSHQQSYKFRKLSGYFHERYTGLVSFTSLNSSYGVSNPYVDFLPVPNEHVTVLSASNGLLLCKATDGGVNYFICNPATKKWKLLPEPRFYHGEKPAIALAFEPSVLNMEAHYELICAFPRLDEPVLSLEIYSSKSNEWRCIDSLCSELAKSKLKSNGFYFNGVAYWETESYEVLAFDISSGIHGVLELPSAATAGGALGQMGGEVCYACVQKVYGRVFKVSVYSGMDMDLRGSVELDLGSRGLCGGSRSWKDEEDVEIFRIMPFFTDEMVTLLVDGSFYVCDVSKGRVESVMRGWNLSGDATYWPYVNSLVRVAGSDY